MQKSTRRFAGLALTWVLLPALSPAQARRHLPEFPAPVRIRGVDFDELESRAGPIRLVGREEGENGFRHLTPSLERSDREIARVDPEELYARKLAIYEEAAEFHTVHEEPGATPPATRKRNSEVLEPPEPSFWKWIVFGLLVGVAAAFAYSARERKPDLF